MCLVLLADSQLLFSSQNSSTLRAFLLAKLRGRCGIYLGAANGDEEDYFLLAKAAFSALGATLQFHRSDDGDAKLGLDSSADFYVLAGGDVAQGWRYLSQPQVHSALSSANRRGALFIGVSAGAIHLARMIEFVEQSRLLHFLGWLPAAIAVHEEREGWPSHRQWSRAYRDVSDLVCIPFGGGVVVVADQLYQTGREVKWYTQEGEVILPSLASRVE
ncbi:Hypothetical protein HDN1F_13670 [gamma proteobacterium HdN1]|nr:Hypothetical protein HDN1F_13670 [gamma proteobacterium HdN1]